MNQIKINVNRKGIFKDTYAKYKTKICHRKLNRNHQCIKQLTCPPDNKLIRAWSSALRCDPPSLHVFTDSTVKDDDASVLT